MSGSSGESFAREAQSASGATRTSCGGCAAPRSQPCARRLSRPSGPRSGGSCPAGRGSTGGRACGRRSSRCRRSRFRCRCGRARFCRGAFPNYQPAWLDQLCATGELVWVGAGLDRVAVYFREDAPALGRLAAADPPEGEVPDRIRAVLGQGAEFWFDLLAATEIEAEQALPALWELVWSGEVTNDAWTPLRAGRRYGVPRPERRPRRFSRRRSSGITATQGRWSLADRLFRGAPDRRALAELLLERQGIVTRDGVRAEGIVGGYSAVYGELKALETLGLARRGYFVEGLGGAQFALGGAVERLRELRPKEGEEPDALVLAAADPAQPYGAALPWPKLAGGRAARVAGRAGRPPRRRARALRRAWRPLDRLAPRAWRGVAQAGAGGARRAREDDWRQAAGGRALRLRAGGGDGSDAAPPRGRLPSGASPGGLAPLARARARIRRAGPWPGRRQAR